VNRNSKYKIPAWAGRPNPEQFQNTKFETFLLLRLFGNLDLGFIWDLKIEIWDL
jgi:hypothetical protein